MKKTILIRCILFISLFASIAQVSAQSASEQKLKDQIVGVWLYGGIMYHTDAIGKGENVYRSFTPRILKVVSGDGTYISIECSNGGFAITGSGTYKITSDSTYVEQVDNQLNSYMVGTENTMTVRLSPDGDAMSNRFLLTKLSDGVDVNVEITEYWDRAEMPNTRDQPSKLSAKEKIDAVAAVGEGSKDTKPKLRINRHRRVK